MRNVVPPGFGHSKERDERLEFMCLRSMSSGSRVHARVLVTEFVFISHGFPGCLVLSYRVLSRIGTVITMEQYFGTEASTRVGLCACGGTRHDGPLRSSLDRPGELEGAVRATRARGTIKKPRNLSESRATVLGRVFPLPPG